MPDAKPLCGTLEVFPYTLCYVALFEEVRRIAEVDAKRPVVDAGESFKLTDIDVTYHLCFLAWLYVTVVAHMNHVPRVHLLCYVTRHELYVQQTEEVLVGQEDIVLPSFG